MAHDAYVLLAACLRTRGLCAGPWGNDGSYLKWCFASAHPDAALAI